MVTAETIKEMIAEQLDKPVSDILEDKEVVKDLGADSLDVMQMLMNLEEQYNITISDEDAVNIKTVGDIINLINSSK